MMGVIQLEKATCVNLDQYNQHMTKSDPKRPLPPSLRLANSTVALLSSQDASTRLGISKASLYAYVSRGMLSAVTDSDDPRQSRYSSFEIEGLLLRKQQGRKAPTCPQAALTDGWSLVDTCISGVVDNKLVYRGHDAVTWAKRATLEETAALLWDTPVSDAFDAPIPRLGARWGTLAHQLRTTPAPERALALLALALPKLEGGPWVAEGLPLARALGSHLRVVFASFLGMPPSAVPMHEQVANAWGLAEHSHDALRTALVLVADYVVNPMALTARMLVSVHGPLGPGLLAALCYAKCNFNGGEVDHVESLWDELLAQTDPVHALRARLNRGEALPGFEHQYFPGGDPRGALLVKIASAMGSPAGQWVKLIGELTDRKPAMVFGLVALRRALGAPRDAATVLMYAGKSVGLLAHMAEQRQQGQRAWIRSRYVGPAR
jgi:citrate synthase